MWLPSVSGLMLIATEFKFPVIGESAQLFYSSLQIEAGLNAVGQSHGVLAPCSAACAVGQAFPAGRQDESLSQCSLFIVLCRAPRQVPTAPSCQRSSLAASLQLCRLGQRGWGHDTPAPCCTPTWLNRSGTLEPVCPKHLGWQGKGAQLNKLVTYLSLRPPGTCITFSPV